jgi:hypothetical protein
MIKSAPKTAVTFGGANEDPRIGYWGPMSREGKDQEAVSSASICILKLGRCEIEVFMVLTCLSHSPVHQSSLYVQRRSRP